MGRPSEQMQDVGKGSTKAPTGDGWPRPVLHADDTVETFITRHAEAMADTGAFSAPVRKALIERSISLGIRSWESPDAGQTLVTYGDEALKSIKEKRLGRDYDILQLDDWKISEEYWDNIRAAQKDPAAFVRDTARYVIHAQARELMQPGTAPAESDVYAFNEKLRQAGFHKIATDNAGEMFDAYQKMYANLGRNPEFHKYADSVADKVRIAAEHGVVSERARDGILKEVEGLKTTYRIWTPEETAAFEQKRANGMKPYQDLLTEMEYLRDSFAKRGNTSLGAGALPFHMAMDMIRKVDGFEKIVTEGTPEAAKAFISANGLEKWHKAPGSLAKYADSLTQMDESHFKFFKQAHALMEATGWTPAIGAAKIMDNVLEGNRKGLSQKEITFNIAVDLGSELGAKKLTGRAGSVATEAMGEFVRVSAAEFVKDPTRAGLGKALSTGFYEAVTTTITHDVVKKLDPQAAKELREFLVESASKLGALEHVKPYIERVFSPPAKEVSSNSTPAPMPVTATPDTGNYRALLGSAEKLKLPDDVTPGAVALKAADVATRERVNASVIVQGSRDPEALTAVDPVQNLRTSTFTVAEVRQMDASKTLEAVEQRNVAQQQDAMAADQRNARQA